ncbi:MAG: hypothetical protein A2249_02555 [Candidatus Jacksonbacteria bacterium RIFOXYA2_FULL_44_7]|uniref:Uncharacterized protein n=1 Tax=Candidatus Jacksonbacteria bacterium RIFCSPLOWO2_02_FULL_44_20 TaxID=1798460 RepID=A0A1G2A9P7_9BACT|nr:MAG: Polysaccharide biosynthesis protein [Parcubacteria group bacterium GW2011_GWC2_44_17]KKT50066.1 MAG: Polysaccharide biosynthesis protein [Parcubacteria group bacterium GW2011_GWF2_44_17]OGY69493.1 MAG: hypothetical protein A3C00_00325 [Candidatus Jacksonbacteria bacterium RIFCSPHIGHO2_02_FULL_44_25]OGY72777.1 MAG: hypothetical protein A3H61_02385 [Candidatus Jacksonbacteria bacterium RIFCSPLOWO2_02_FULL_44_20]OGY77040.1 MAG: hypothetical protein A2249_02555 [Candidatus Jacksonbacteria b
MRIASFLFNNRTVKQTLLKNSVWLGFVKVANLLTMLLSVIAARKFGADEFGKFSFAMAFVSLFSVVVTAGIPTIIIREFAREEKRKNLFAPLILLGVFLGVLAFFLILLFSIFITDDVRTKSIIIPLGIYIIIQGFTGIFFAFFRAYQKMEYEAWIKIPFLLVLFFVGMIALFYFPSIESLSVSYLIASVVILALTVIFFSRRLHPISLRFDMGVMKHFLLLSWPLAFASVFNMIYIYIDSVFMGYWGMTQEIGWYNAAYKIVNFTTIPMFLVTDAFYPALSSLKETAKKTQKIWDQFTGFMIIAAVPLIVGGIAIAPKIIRFFYGSSYDPSILAFQILICVGGIMYLTASYNTVLLVANRQKILFLITAIGGIMNIVLNFILIPRFSLYGAAWATLITYFSMLALFVLYVRLKTEVKPITRRVFSILIMSILATALMYGIITHSIIAKLPMLLLALIGFLSYSLSFLVFFKIHRRIFHTI